MVSYRFHARCTLVMLLVTALFGGCASGQNRPLQLVRGDGPVYPAAARQAGIEGQVVLRYDVTTAGRVTNVSVVSAVPAGVFEESAIAAVRSWVYRPPLVRGAPAPVYQVESRLTFRIGADEYAEY